MFEQALRRAEELKSRSDYYFIIEDGPLTLEFWLLKHPNEMQLIWNSTNLGGQYPGGTLSMSAPQVAFIASTGKRLDVDLGPKEPIRNFKITGLEAYRSVRGMPMSRLPWSKRVAIPAGEYTVKVCYEANDNAGDGIWRETKEVGKIVVERDLIVPSQKPMNELAIFEPDWSEIMATVPPSVPSRELPPQHPVKYFKESFDKACANLDEWHCDPYNTEHRLESSLNPQAYIENERAFGMYLPGLSYAYLTTGEANYYYHASYCYRKLVDNIWDAPWDGYWGSIWNMHEIGVLLHESINAQGGLDFCEITHNRSLADPFYRLFKNWPVDVSKLVLKNEINSRGEDVYPSFVYNQVFGGVKVLWLIGNLYGDDSLKSLAREGFHQILLPDFMAEGYWNYNRGGELSTHYDILLKSYVGQLLWYPEWQSNERFAECAKKGADFCLANVAEDADGEIIWSGRYSNEDTVMLALGKAAMVTELLAPLVHLGYEQYAAPLKKTVAFIYNRRYHPDIRDFWGSAWAQFSVIAPLVRIAHRGVDIAP